MVFKRGQAIVEFALVVTVFLMVMFAIIDWGIYFHSLFILDGAVRDAARAAVTYGNWSGNSDIYEGTVNDLVVERSVGLRPVLQSGLSSRVAISFDETDPNNKSITVEVSGLPYTSITGFADIMLPNTIGARAVMRYERN